MSRKSGYSRRINAVLRQYEIFLCDFTIAVHKHLLEKNSVSKQELIKHHRKAMTEFLEDFLKIYDEEVRLRMIQEEEARRRAEIRAQQEEEAAAERRAREGQIVRQPWENEQGHTVH